ncbi:MAG TPA: class I SAM-dependent rRNA methyltransferase [Pyrodictium sp.]|nr:class I SAM-dependent rRNA methyltransferase [Pyrodictium sp.]
MLPVIRVHHVLEKEVLDRGTLMIYSKWIVGPRPKLEPGELVIVESERGELLGCGFYDTVGPVAIRLVSIGYCKYSSAKEAIMDRLEKAYRKRKMLGIVCTECGYRLVHSDGDMLPGLIIDYYNELIVYQSSSIVWDKLQDVLVESLLEVYDSKISVYEKSVQRTRLEIGLQPKEGLRYGNKTTSIVVEGSVKLYVDPRRGQKTGLFLDQRRNRILLERFIAHLEKPMVLDLFSYTGGFGIHALAADAKKAVFVEQDKKAIEILLKNIELNKIPRNKIEIINDNVWRTLRYLARRKERYQTIIVDPPAFIPHKEVKQKGKEAYLHLYQHSLHLLDKPGIIFYSSCSAFLGEDEFKEVIQYALTHTNYHMLTLQRTPEDHPSRPSAPYLDYLKSAYILVED